MLETSAQMQFATCDSYLFLNLRSFALFCADLRSCCTFFAHVCARFGGNLTLGIKKTRPNGISARIVKKRSEANGRQKVLRRVNFGIEQGGRQKFMLRWRFQDMLCFPGGDKANGRSVHGAFRGVGSNVCSEQRRFFGPGPSSYP